MGPLDPGSSLTATQKDPPTVPEGLPTAPGGSSGTQPSVPCVALGAASGQGMEAPLFSPQA